MGETHELLPLPPEGVGLNNPEVGRYVACEGLAPAETHGRWTESETVRLRFRLPFRPEGGVVLRLESLGYVARGLVAEQRVELSVNGHRM